MALAFGRYKMTNLTLTIVEVFISLVIESVILSGVFSYLSNKQSEKQEQHLKDELQVIEEQNKFIYEQLQTEIRLAKADMISEIKECLK
jgi:hypothetical protein